MAVGDTARGPDGEPDLDLIEAVSRDVVVSMVPAELPLFPATSKRLREHSGSEPRGSGRDDILAFGPAEMVGFLTPVIWLTTAEVVAFVGVALKDAATEHTGKSISRMARRVFHSKPHSKDADSKDPDGEPPVRLNPAQLAEVRAVAFKKALALKLPRDQAQLLADALAGTLAV